MFGSCRVVWCDVVCGRRRGHVAFVLTTVIFSRIDYHVSTIDGGEARRGKVSCGFLSHVCVYSACVYYA